MSVVVCTWRAWLRPRRFFSERMQTLYFYAFIILQNSRPLFFKRSPKLRHSRCCLPTCWFY